MVKIMTIIEVRKKEELEKEIEKARKEKWNSVNWDGSSCWCKARNGRVMKKIILKKEV